MNQAWTTKSQRTQSNTKYFRTVLCDPWCPLWLCGSTNFALWNL